MNHDRALESSAVERYVFGDMSEEEAAAFETHVFDCRACSKELELTASFADNARVALGTQPAALLHESKPVRSPAPPRSPWAVVVPYAAAALFAGIAIYQGVVVVPGARRASEPRALQPAILRVVRAEPPVVRIDPGAASFLLVIDLDSPETFPRYEVEFRSTTGVGSTRFESDAPPSGTLHLLLPADRFPDGDYDMVLSGRDATGATAGKLIETYRFRVLR